jgi:hypothetical protein
MFRKLRKQIIAERVRASLPADLSLLEREMIFGNILEGISSDRVFMGKDGEYYIIGDGGVVTKLDDDDPRGHNRNMYPKTKKDETKETPKQEGDEDKNKKDGK